MEDTIIKGEKNKLNYSRILERYIKGIHDDEELRKEAYRVEFLHKNFDVGWFDILFPYHMRPIHISDAIPIA